jgi:hypothetical protein
MIGIPTPTWLPSLSTAEDTCTFLVGFADVDVEDAGAEDGADTEELSGALGVRVCVTVTLPLPDVPELHAAATTASADTRAPTTREDRRGRRFLTRPP